jgi:citrate synthase
MTTDDRGWISTEEAAARLGVKPATLYAYVSRGILRSERVPGAATRRSRFLRADVDKLASRNRAGSGRAAGLEILVETSLTHLDPNGRVTYRGWDVEDAARTATFEEVASWLWTGARVATPFVAPARALPVAAELAGLDVGGLTPLDQLRLAVTALRPGDPLRDDRRASAVADTGRALIASLLEVLPVVRPPKRARRPSGTSSTPGVAERLWPRLTDRPAGPTELRILNAALVLLADHELAASTLAARVAASTWADPYLAVLAGLAALGGPLHGAVSSEARPLVRRIADGATTAAEQINGVLRDGSRVPGFGHRVYLDRDPRFDVLFELVSESDSADADVRRAVSELVGMMRDRGLPFANVDLAIAHFTEAYDMIPGAGEVVFAIARIVGWLAHAAEEYEHRLRFRPRAVYVGPPLLTNAPASLRPGGS